MQTQGISLIASEMSGMVSSKSTKATDATFQSFMSERASKVGNQDTKYETTDFESANHFNDKKVTAKPTESKPEMKDASKQEIGNSAKTTTETVKQEDIMEEIDVNSMNHQMMQFLQELFGLSEEEIQDILGQMGIGLQDLMFQIQNGDVSAVSVDNLQNLIMEVHGITDKAAFLTNSQLSREWNQLVEYTTQLVADAMGVSVEELGQVEQSLMLSFSEQLKQSAEKNDGESALEEKNVALDDITDDLGNQSDAGKMRVVVEMENDGTDQGAKNDSMLSTTEQTVSTEDVASDAKAAANLFTEKLEQAFGQEGNQVEATGKTMTQIVEQVVNQVKIRVMPETTSMELQLHPASLGRVNLQVSSTNGTATAVLTVENQIAKEALESQMITLKETFAEQGLKVDAVEVTVSEFGLDHHNREASQEQQKHASEKRKFRAEAGLSAEDGSMSEKETDVVRRDVNSVVDYTA